MIQLIIIALVAILWYFGGQHNGKMFRRIAIPIILGLYIAIKLKCWWLFFVVGASMQTVGLGYGSISPDDPKPSLLASLLHDTNGWWTRSLWGLIIASFTALGLIVGGFISLWAYLAYILGNSIVGFFISKFKLNVILCDLSVGIGISSIIFLL